MTTFILASAGLASIITTGKIFEPLRSWAAKKNAWLGETFECSQCVGFWAGAITCLLIEQPSIANLTVYGCAGSITSVTATSIVECINSLSNYLENKTVINGRISDIRPVMQRKVTITTPKEKE